jgi:hypothetical protein
MDVYTPAPDDAFDTITHDARRQAIRLEVLQELAGRIGPELSNIFAVISGTLQLQIMELGGDPAAYRWTQNALQTAALGARLASDILDFAGPVAEPLYVDLQQLLTAQQPTLRSIIGAAATLNVVQSDTSPLDKLWPVRAFAAPIAAVLRTLAEHARITMPPGGIFAVTASNIGATGSGVAATSPSPTSDHVTSDQVSRDHVSRDHVTIAVTYPARGLSAEELRGVMMPGFMVKPRADSSTLNLATAAATLRRCGGSLTVAMRQTGAPEWVQDGGINVCMVLPRAKWQSPDWFGCHQTTNA